MNKIELLKSRFNNEIKDIIYAIKKYNPIKIILFGSWAKNEINEYSDIDLCIIKETKDRFIDRIGDVLNLINSTFPVEVVVYNTKEINKMISENNSFINEIISNGQVLYELKS